MWYLHLPEGQVPLRKLACMSQPSWTRSQGSPALILDLAFGEHAVQPRTTAR